MDEILKEIQNLSPEQRKQFEEELKSLGIDIKDYIESSNSKGELFIPTAKGQEFNPMSAAQKRLYIINNLEADSTAYNMPLAFEIEGKLDFGRLEYSLKKLINRHESFRTSFRVADGEAKQFIDEEVDFKIELLETSKDIEIEVKRFIRPFDLSKAPLIRAGLLKIEEERNILIVDMHHIIADGSSVSIIREEFIKLYKGEELEKLEIQYRDFALWQKEYLHSEAMKNQEKYWLDIFKGELPVLELPADYTRSTEQDFMGDEFGFKLDHEITQNIREFCIKNDITLFMFVVAAYKVLLSKITGQEDIIIGIPSTGRKYHKFEKIVGMFVNTLALRSYPQKEKKFIQYLQEIRTNSLKAFENQDYQFEMLLDKLQIKRDPSRNPLIDTIVNMQSMFEAGEESIEGVVFKPYCFENKTVKFDITLYVFETSDTIHFSCSYKARLFKRASIEYIMKQYTELIKELLQNPDKRIEEYEILKKETCIQVNRISQKAVSKEFEEFKKADANQSITARFEKIAEQYKDRIAIKKDRLEYTYRDLNNKANRAARTILACTENKTVGVYLGNGMDVVTAMLGILKAGKIYVPLDSNYPKERLLDVIEDSGIQTIITDNSNISTVKNIDTRIQIININEISEETDHSNIGIEITQEDIAYIVYTSGSTGKPKGVMQSHGSVMNLMYPYINQLHFGKEDKIGLLTAYSHQVAIIDILSALLTGGSIYPYEIKTEGSMEKMPQWLKEEQIKIFHSVPTLYRYIMEKIQDSQDLSCIRTVILGGEAVHKYDVELYKKHFNENCTFVNFLGCSEVLATALYIIDKATEIEKETVPVGYEIENIEIQLLDENGKEAGEYKIGEIAYKSRYLSPGYWNDEEKTREAFVRKDGVAIYKSGDLGRRLPDGRIEYLGRNDSQVKLRGYRIETSEIEGALKNIDKIKASAVVLVKDSLEQDALAVYYELKEKAEEENIDKEDIKRELLKKLPDYMIPSYFVRLDEMPITVNGKIDRKKLSDMVIQEAEIIFETAQNETQSKLADIWKAIIKEERISINDNFFEIGGHSLKATTMIYEIHREFDVQIPLKEVFKNPTIKKLSVIINKAEKNKYSGISKVEKKESYEMSPSQKRMYMLSMIEGTTTAYNQGMAVIAEGALCKNKLENTIHKLIRRHETLRTSFEIQDGTPVQIVHEDVGFAIEYFEAGEEEAQKIIKEFVRPFDLGKAPLLRAALIKIEENRHIIMCDMHHIITDGTSEQIFLREFAKCYSGFNLEELNVQYKDYSELQNRLLKSDEILKQEKYWLDTFRGEIPVLNLPLDYQRPAAQSFEGENMQFEIEKELTEKLEQIAKDTGSTMYMLLLAAYSTLLYKYTGQEDIVVGTPVAGRQHADLQGIIGMFVNTLAMKNNPEGSKKFKDFLKEVKENALKAYENQDYQFEELVEKLDLRRDMSRNPLFDVMFILQNTEGEIFEIDGLTFKPYNFENKISKFDMTLSAVEQNGKIYFSLEYCSKLFKKETIQRIAGHYVNTLKDITDCWEKTLSEINMLSEDEMEQMLYGFNDTELDYPKDKTIHELFEEQVERTPDSIAVVFGDKQLTYRELNQKANRIAGVLREKGIKKDSIVGLLVPRSLEMIIGMLAILKAGGAYLPIDMEYPEERIRYILEDSGVKILLSEGSTAEKTGNAYEIIDIFDKRVYIGEGSNLQTTSTPEDLAYVIYTSGSTGKPKGVMIEHRNVSNFIKGISEKIDFAPEKTILSVTTIAFDIFVLESLLPLTKGLKIVIANEEQQLSAEKLGELIAGNQVNMIQTTPSRINMVLSDETGKQSLGGLSEIIVGGEVFPVELLKKLNSCCTGKIYNMYGPTETTVWSTMQDVTGKGKPDIGKPISNTQIYILDKNRSIVPAGAAGDLYISGDGVARGYLNSAELTQKKFIDNPFIPGKLLYFTGDRARWRPDGNIEFLGREDNQVKIRGYRIELGEIESRLLKHEQIDKAVVLAKEDETKSKYLCAYIVPEGLADKEIREYLSKELPDYMVPLKYVYLHELPLTPNGKIDRKELPEPDRSMNTGAGYAAPENKTEERLVQIWQEVLGTERVGIMDSFFDLGGHSLKAAIIISQIHKEFNADISLKEMFKKPFIRNLAQLIRNSGASSRSMVELVKEQKYYPLSAAQERLYIINNLESNSIAYNIPYVIDIDGKLNMERLEYSFNKLIKRHEVFRTSFKIVDGSAVQSIAGEVDFSIELLEISEDVEREIEKFIRPFDLSKAPLIRAGIIRMEEERHILILDLHHIISDGSSMNIIRDEFIKIFKGEELEELKIQYKDFAVWQKEYLQSEAMKKQEKYWLETLKGELPVLELPSDYPRDTEKDFGGDKYIFSIENETTKDIRAFCRKNNITLFMFITAVYNILLSKITGQEDIIIGIPCAGRNNYDLKNMIGMFVNTLVLRSYPEKEKTFMEFLHEVRENSLGAFENQDYQFETLLDNLQIKKGLSSNSLVNTIINMQNMFEADEESIANINGLIFKPHLYENKTAKFDMYLYVSETSDEIYFNCSYRASIFKKSSIESMMKEYTELIKEVLSNDDKKIKDYKVFKKETDKKAFGENIIRISKEYNEFRSEDTNQSIAERFEKIAEQFKDRIAIKKDNIQYTYDNLNEKANMVARAILNSTESQTVGVFFEHGMDVVTAMLGIFKAGKIYVPLDSNYPKERLLDVIQDSGIQTIITNNKNLSTVKSISDKSAMLLNIDELHETDGTNLKIKINLKDTAFIVYTSGSTGKPKGVMQNHESVMKLMCPYINMLHIGKEDKIALLTAYSHVVATIDILSALLNGGSIYPYEIKAQGSIEKISQWIKEEQITILHSVPTLYGYIMEKVRDSQDLSSVRMVILGGEAVHKYDVEMYKQYFNQECIFVNLLGCSEVIATAAYIIDKNTEIEKETVPVGYELENIEIQLLDENDRDAGVYCTGEIVYKSSYLSPGYWKDEEKTRKAFMEKEGARIYKSGDLGRRLPDGRIEYLGRNDLQVKIRGYRIEISEIEGVLKNIDQIKASAVILIKDRQGQNALAAYYEIKEADKNETVIEDIKARLLRKLPEFMVPSFYVELDEMPLTVNGKIDRQKLSDMGIPETSDTFETAQNEIQSKLMEIWKAILKEEKISINDNFFEIGGHSLKATTMLYEIHKKLNVQIPLKEIFENPTIKKLSEYIKNSEKNKYFGIPKVEKKESYEMSSAQKRMYLLSMIEGASTAYNQSIAVVVEGELDKNKLENTIQKLINRHETLRTSFEMKNGAPLQIINGKVEFAIEYHEAKEEEASKILKEFTRPYDLSKAPLLRIALIKTQEKKYILMCDMHHIITDGTSADIFIKEFAKQYNGFELVELKIHYKDYSAWQNELLKSDEMKKQEEYWLNTFKGEIPLLDMALDYQRPAVQSFEGGNLAFEIGEELAQSLERTAKETESTMYMVLLAAYNILLYRYTGQKNIIVGTPIAGRQHADLQSIIGMFVNTLAMKNNPDGSKKFRDFLKEVKYNALKAYENQDYQFDELVEKLDIKRDMSRNPLFDVMFVLQNTEREIFEINGLAFKPYDFESKISKFDLTLSATEQNGKIYCNMEYCSRLYKKETIERLARHYLNILKYICGNLNPKISEIEMLSEEEKEQLLIEFNNTKVDYPKHKTMHKLFEEQAEKEPDNIALVLDDNKMTYGQLNKKANQLARILLKRGVKSGDNVGLIADRNFEMIIGMLGILKAGGAYVPIDPSYPGERQDYILENSKASVIVADKEYGIKADSCIRIDYDEMRLYSEENLDLEKNTSDLAYVIYTSGSTGMPKGVMIEHHSAVNLITWVNKEFKVNRKDTLLFITSMCFDLSVYDIFGILAAGGKAVIAKKEQVQDPQKLGELIVNQKITFWDSVPTTMNHLINSITQEYICEDLRLVFMSGDWIPVKLPEKIRKHYPNARVISLGGATEGTVWSIYYPVKEAGEYQTSIPYGKPIDNNYFYIVDENLCAVPNGVTGELCIGGVGVARGYMNEPEKTKASFLPNPFVHGNNERIYRTGDLGRMLLDGNIEFLGRKDHQVKIRGFRVELGEVEAQILKHEHVKETVVVDGNDAGGDKYLCAYIVSEKEIEVRELRSFLAKTLPDYMIPSYCIRLDKIPLTSNGKIDRKALPGLDGNINTGVEYEAPGNKLEEKLAVIWQELLGVDRIGINDNFFDLGGHSLKATVLISRMHKEFDAEVPLRDIFTFNTIKELARYIENSRKSVYESITAVGEREYYPASAAQKRLYILDKIEGPSTTYNIPIVLTVEGELKKDRMEDALRGLIQRHESLRTSFDMVEGEVVQRIHKEAEFEAGYIESTEDKIKEIVKGFIRPFDLKKSPLTRAGIIRLSEYKHIIMFDMHHIISDGTSMGILVGEFSRLYNREAVPELKVQYKDFAAWQNELLGNGNINKQEEYWLDVFGKEIPVLNLPSDYPRPLMQSFEGDSIWFGADRELVKKIRELSGKTGTTLYMTLLGAYYILLSKYSGQEDIVVGSPIAGRRHADLEAIIGMFVNTLAMRNYPEGSKTVEEFLLEVKENAFKAYENQDYQFEELVEKLEIQRDMSRNPLFDTMFVLQNTEVEVPEIEGLKFIQYEYENAISKFDITLNARETGDEIVFVMEYCTRLYKKETMERFAQHYLNILKNICENPDQKISEVEMLSRKEKEQLLIEFNNTGAEYARDKTIHQLFEEQAIKIPGSIAVIYEDIRLTYKELNERANQLAIVLRDRGVKGDSAVGIMVERSVEMIIGIMGILKAGGAYLPISPSYPTARTEYILEDSGSKIMLATKGLEKQVPSLVQTVYLDDETLLNGSADNIENINKPNDLAYIIYTSGSTGNPKGVMIEHKSVLNLVNSLYKNIYSRHGNNLNVALLAPYIFDASVQQIFASLLLGHSLCITPEESRLHGRSLLEFYAKNSIQISDGTPVHIAMLAESFSGSEDINVEHFIIGGDALPYSSVKSFYDNYKGKKPYITNVYGPTECCVDSTSLLISPGLMEAANSISIGTPMHNVKIYILDKDLKAVPAGVTGELCIAGDGLARGYLNQPELTQEKFTENPYVKHEKIYHTGDLAKWLPDGNIEYLGRMDNQVKIRGYRIELGEIEAQLLKHEQIKEAVVIAKDDEAGNKYLCAYILPRAENSKELAVQNIREHLSKELPEYMIPLYFVQLSHMPMTQNGKLDRKALPEHGRIINTGVGYAAAQSDAEKKLAEIYQAVLGIERVGINDSFFDLGGDSIKAIQVTSKAEQSGINIMVSDVLRYKTISKIVENVDVNKVKKAAAQEEVKGKVLLTPVQKWFFELDSGCWHYWNQAMLFSIKEDTDLNLLESVLRKIIEHHDALRLGVRIEEKAVELFNRGINEIPFNIEVIDLSRYGYEIQKQKLKEASERIQDNMNPEKELPVKACIFELGQNGKRLLIVVHHLAIDGVSWRILFEDIEKLYKSKLEERLPLKTTSFKEWSQKLHDFAGQNPIDTKYWEDMDCAGVKTLSKVPVEDNYLKDHEKLGFAIDEEHTLKLLTQVNKAYGTEINDILLSALTMSVTEASHSDSILFMLEGYGREELIEDANISRTVGWFTSIYPVCLEKQKGIKETISAVKQSLRKVPSKGINYGIARYIKNNEKLGQLNPEICFNYLGQMDMASGAEMGLLSACTEEFGRAIHTDNRYDYLVDINGYVAGGSLCFSITYNGKYIDLEIAKSISRLFEEYLISIIEHCVDINKACAESKNPGLFQINEPGKKELKVVVHNEITAYLCHSLPISVILADERLHPWFYGHYMEIFSKTEEDGSLYLDFTEARAAYNELIQEVYMGYELLEDVTDIIDYVIHKINLGYYVIIHVDEYYIPEKRTYKKQHYVHHSLVYGYDNESMKLKAVGFNAQQMFTNISIDYDSFRNGYESGKLYYRDAAPWAATNAIELLRPRDYRYEYPFSIEKFMSKLKQNMDSKGDFSKVYSSWADKEVIRENKVKYGLEVYDDLIHHLYNLMNKELTVNYIALHILFEHKKSIHKRLLYVASKYGIEGRFAQLAGMYDEVREMVDNARRIFFEHAFTWDEAFYNPFPEKEALEQIIEILIEAKNKEEYVLTELYEELQKIMGSLEG